MSDEQAHTGGADSAQAPHGRLTTKIGIDTEELTGRTFPYQFDRALVEDVDLVAATPGADINWLEDVHLMHEDNVPAVFDRYTNAFLKIHFEIPAGREDEYARKVLITHLRAGNSYGIWLKGQNSAPGGRTPPSWAGTGSRPCTRTGKGRPATSRGCGAGEVPAAAGRGTD